MNLGSAEEGTKSSAEVVYALKVWYIPHKGIPIPLLIKRLCGHRQ